MGALACTVCMMDIIFQLFSLEALVPDSSSSSGNKQNVCIWFSQFIWARALPFSSLTCQKYYLNHKCSPFFSLQFHLSRVGVLPPDYDKYLQHLKPFPGEDTLILATLLCRLLGSSFSITRPLHTIFRTRGFSLSALNPLLTFSPWTLTTIYVLMTFK